MLCNENIYCRIPDFLILGCKSRTGCKKLCYFIYSKVMVDEVFSLKNPSEAVEEVETLPEEFYNKPLILEKGSQHQQ